MSSITIVEIPLQEILLATKDFAEEIFFASGGYGPVYQGKSEKHGMIAVKRLDRKNGQGDVEFRKEIALLSEYKHKNIVSLLGFCDENDDKILVYKLESNGSLDKHLNNEDLSWTQRLRICLDAAQGLKYLHDDVGPQQRILHRDVKSANILLDERWNAKISDFGLSRIGPANIQTTLLISNACGTFGYIDPEYLYTGSLTQKSDVYSFGVVLFEVLCARPTCVKAYNDERQFLTVLVYKHYPRQTLDKLIPFYLQHQIGKASLDTFLTIAYQCLKNGIERPTMNHVVQQLRKALDDQLMMSFCIYRNLTHTGGNIGWEAINSIIARDQKIGLSHFELLKKLESGDIGSVYLVELRGTNTFFAMKVMDKASLASQNKLRRAQTEKEILGLLNHPFLPTLYSSFKTDKFYCLVMEICSGGNLHTLRLKQATKNFTEEATRFFASQVLLALEYLHMLGIVYRDLKPENVLVRDEGHIMLSNFDLSLRCSVNPTLVKSSHTPGGNNLGANGGGGGTHAKDDNVVHTCSNLGSKFFARLLPSKKNRKSKSDLGVLVGGPLPELMAEPTNVKSNSFVGTHEYLAPEIICGIGHGSGVDWWTFGIFLYELLYGRTPFKGQGNLATLDNVVGQPLRFPESPQVSHNARDLIKGLLVKEPQKRIAYRRGATEIKQHPFFEGVNWALVRNAHPPHVPEPVDFSQFSTEKVSDGNFEYF